MQFPLFSVAVFAGLAVAQFAGLPTCAQNCASEQFTGGSYAGCGTDAKCICANQNFLSNVACCLVGDCNQADQASAITFASQICSAQGVSVPSVVSCATASSAQSSGSATATSGTAVTTGTASSTATATSAGTATTGSTGSAAWAPKQTAAIGMELLGLAAAGLALL